MATTWEISFKAIKTDNKASAELLLLCSFLHNEDITEEMLRRGKELDNEGKSDSRFANCLVLTL